jgi:hypothetical protein
MTNPFFLIGAATGICLLALLYAAQKDPVRYAIPSGLGAFLTIFGMSYAREALRMQYLNRFSYSIFQRKLNIDWGSTLLFLATFVLGLVVISYLVLVVYKSGRVEGQYGASSPMHGLSQGKRLRASCVDSRCSRARCGYHDQELLHVARTPCGRTRIRCRDQCGEAYNQYERIGHKWKSP